MVGWKAALLGMFGAAAASAAMAAPDGGSAVAGEALGAGGGGVTAEAAHRAAAAGEVTLIDIRTPQEWASTGTPEGAMRLNLQARDFGDKLLGMLQDPNAKPVALICATGGRTGAVMSQLRRMGLAHRVYDVSEGMMGSMAGPGWLKRGLPLDR